MAKREKRNQSRGSVGNNRKAGEDFFAKNRKKEGIIETDSGLQYQILEAGEGDSPSEDSYVTLHQRAWVLNGAVIEDTFKENEPDAASIKEMIDGYKEGVLLMKKGSRYKLFVPPELGWGKKGHGTKIPPSAVLVFDVRLIDFW